MIDPIIHQIEQFRCSRGELFAERRNRGYTLYDAGSGAPVARLRPFGQEGRFEGILLVALEGTMGLDRAIRTHHPVDR